MTAGGFPGPDDVRALPSNDNDAPDLPVGLLARLQEALSELADLDLRYEKAVERAARQKPGLQPLLEERHFRERRRAAWRLGLRPRQPHAV